MTKIADGVSKGRVSFSPPTPARVSRTAVRRDAGRAPSAVTPSTVLTQRALPAPRSAPKPSQLSLREGYSLIAEATLRGVVPSETGSRLCRLILEVEA